MKRVSVAVRSTVVAALAVGSAVAFAGTASATGAASIAGRVTDSATHAPLGGINVEILQNTTNGGFGGPVTGPGYVTSTTTAPDGSYTVSGLAASDANGYWVCFYGDLGGPTGVYEPQCYVDQPGFDIFPDPFGFQQVPEGSTTVHLIDGQHVTGINAHMVNTQATQPGGIAGKVTQTPLNDALSNVKVTVFNGDGTVAATGVTIKNGTYEVDGLTSGQSYFVCFNGAQAKGGFTLKAYKNQCWKKASWTGAGGPPASATAVPVGSGQVVHNINAALAATI